MSFSKNWIIAECNSTLFIGLAIMVYELIYHNLQIRVRVRVRVHVRVRVSLNLKRSSKIFPEETMTASENRFAPELKEKEVIELLENATRGSIKKATKCGMKIFQGKDLKTLFVQFKHPC